MLQYLREIRICGRDKCHGKYYMDTHNAAVQYTFYGNRNLCVEAEKAHVVLVGQHCRRKRNIGYSFIQQSKRYYVALLFFTVLGRYISRIFLYQCRWDRNGCDLDYCNSGSSDSLRKNLQKIQTVNIIQQIPVHRNKRNMQNRICGGKYAWIWIQGILYFWRNLLYCVCDCDWNVYFYSD